MFDQEDYFLVLYNFHLEFLVFISGFLANLNTLEYEKAKFIKANLILV
jgi:fucose 4-O-acetylase-like acetyltransferase